MTDRRITSRSRSVSSRITIFVLLFFLFLLPFIITFAIRPTIASLFHSLNLLQQLHIKIFIVRITVTALLLLFLFLLFLLIHGSNMIIEHFHIDGIVQYPLPVFSLPLLDGD